MLSKKVLILSIFLMALLSLSVVSAEEISADSISLDDSVDDMALDNEDIVSSDNVEDSSLSTDADSNIDLESDDSSDLMAGEDVETQDETDQVASAKSKKVLSASDETCTGNIKSLTTYYLSDKNVVFTFFGHFKGYFKVYKGSKLKFKGYINDYDSTYYYAVGNLAVGKYRTKLIDNYDGLIASAKLVVKKVKPKVYVKSFTVRPGKKVKVYAYVYNKKSGYYLNGGTVKFRIAGKTYKAKVKNGVAKKTIRAPYWVKKYTCKATFLGTKNAKKSSTKFKMKVKRKKKTKLKKGQYWDYCHGFKNHKAIWTKKYEGKSYDGTVYRNGHYYDRYIKLYTFTCKCTKTKYHRTWLKYHGGKYYSYSTYGPGKHPKYVYIRANLQ